MNIFEQRSWVITNILMYVKDPRILTRSPLKINCRCPVCGDSAKNRKKKRGYFLEGDEGIYYFCHKCGYSRPIHLYIKEQLPHLWQDWIFSQFRDKIKPQVEQEEFKSQRMLPTVSPVDKITGMITPFLELDSNHPVRTYINRRKVPEILLDKMWYTDKWYKVARAVDPEAYPEKMEDWHQPRLVFTLIDQDGVLLGIQGRALRPKDDPKYITVKSSPDFPKIWGLDLVNPKETVPLFEGIIDAAFIDNSCAILGAAAHHLPDLIPNRVWVLDDEPESRHTVHHMNKLIQSGETVLIWDRIPKKGKDINEKILAGQTSEQLAMYIKENAARGLSAKLRLDTWSKT